MSNKLNLLILSIIAAAGTAGAQVDFSQRSISQVSTELQLRTAAGTADTAQINGVAVKPGENGDLFAIHVDSTNRESFLRINAATGVAVKLTDQSTIISQLGSPYAGALTLVGGFVYSQVADALYFAENFTEVNFGDVSMIKIDANNGAASLVTRTTDLEDLNDHTLLPDGTLLATRPGAGVIGTVNANTGAWTQRLTEDDLLAESPGATELPPESIAANPATGETFIFCHDDLDLFRVEDITTTPPAITRLAQPELENVDMHDLAVDEDGNLYGYDVPSNSIIVIRSSDGAAFTFPLADVQPALSGGTPFSATFWRGIAARKINDSQSDLFMSSATSSYGIVQVRFGTAPSSVNEWVLY